MPQELRASDPIIQNFCQTVSKAAENVNQLKDLSGPERDLCKKVALHVSKSPDSPLKLSDNEVSQLSAITTKVKIPFQPSYGIFHFVVSFFKGLGNLLHLRISSKSLQSLLRKNEFVTHFSGPQATPQDKPDAASPPPNPDAPTTVPSQPIGTDTATSTAAPSSQPQAAAAPPVTTPETPIDGLMPPDKAYQQLDALMLSLPLNESVRKELQGKDRNTKTLAFVDVVMHKMNSSTRTDIHDAAFYHKALILLSSIAEHTELEPVVVATLDAVSQRASEKLAEFVKNSEEAKELKPIFEESTRVYTKSGPWSQVYFYASLTFPGDLKHFLQYRHKPLEAFFEKKGAKPEFVETYLGRCEAHFDLKLPADLVYYRFHEQPVNFENLQKAFEAYHLVKPGRDRRQALDEAFADRSDPQIDWKKIAATPQEAKEKIINELNGPGPYSPEAFTILTRAFECRPGRYKDYSLMPPLGDGARPITNIMNTSFGFLKFSKDKSLFSLGKAAVHEFSETILYSTKWTPPVEVSFVLNFPKPVENQLFSAAQPLTTAPVAVAESTTGPMSLETAYQQLDALLQSLPLSASVKKELQGKDPITKALAFADIAVHKLSASDTWLGCSDIHDAAFYYKTALLLESIAHHVKDDAFVNAVLHATAQQAFFKVTEHVEKAQEAQELRPLLTTVIKAYVNWGADLSTPFSLYQFPEAFDNFIKYLHKPLEAYFEKKSAKPELVETYLGRCTVNAGFKIPPNQVQYSDYKAVSCDNIQKALEEKELLLTNENRHTALERAFKHEYLVPIDWQKIAPTLQEAQEKIITELDGVGPYSDEALKMLFYAFSVLPGAHDDLRKTAPLTNPQPLLNHVYNYTAVIKLSDDRRQFALGLTPAEERKAAILFLSRHDSSKERSTVLKFASQLR